MAEPTFLADLVAGTTGGICGIVVGQPADTVKVRMQTQTSVTQMAKTPIQVAQSLMRREGIAGFFRGIVAPVATNAPINATVFVVYGGILRFIEKRVAFDQQLNPGWHFGAGAAAGLVQSVFACPGELLKIKQQVYANTRNAATAIKNATSTSLTASNFNLRAGAAVRSTSSIASNAIVNAAVEPSTWKVATEAVQVNGLRRGLFQGWWLTCARDVPAFGLYFASYEVSKRYLLQDRNWQLEYASLVSGAVAGIVPWALLHPIDVLKSCRQTQCTRTSRWAESLTGTLALANKRYQAHGWRFFLRGITPAVLRAAPVNAVTFSVYEQVMLVMKN